jgi:hypothetical protein
VIRALICIRNKEDPIRHILYLIIDKIRDIFYIKDDCATVAPNCFTRRHMKIAKLLYFLVVGSFFFSGCMPKAGDSSSATPIPTNTFVPKTEHTKLPGNPVPWHELVFYNTGQANYKATREEDRPRLSVITSQEEIGSVEKWLRPEHLPLIQNVDYNESLVLIIFSGYRGENKQGIVINQIVKNGNVVTLSVSFTTPAEGEVRNPLITSPYLILEIQRMDLPENPKFILIADGKEIDQVTPG